mgnify:CR=1 FL=1
MIGILVLILRFLGIFLLFAFLVTALIVIWRDLRAQSKILTKKPFPSLRLIAKEGTTTSFDLREMKEAIAGRDESCEIRIDHDSLSAQHAKFSYHHKQWWLNDMASTNGTMLNGSVVTSPTVIMTGDEIRCGSLTWVVKIEGEG